MSGCGGKGGDKPLTDCCSQPGLMPFEQALAQLLDSVQGGKQPVEKVHLTAALGRVLAEDLCAELDVPPADNSAMDGYAVRVADLAAAAGKPLTISQRIPAGVDPEPLQPGTVARIFTGASVPEGADAVVMQENTERDGEQVKMPTEIPLGDHIRRRGQDIANGDAVVKAGTRLQPQHLGVLASIGIAELPCYRPLRVALLSSGDELAQPGEVAGPGQIYNSNRYSLTGLIQQLGMELIDLGTIEDTRAATIEALQGAAEKADLLITSGGVSVGEEDHIKAAVEQLGEISLWKLAIKPGKPLAFGRVGQTPFIGLPGNPVSAMLCFQVLARPVMMKLQGAGELHPKSVMLPIDYQRSKAQKRREYLRVRRVEQDGQLVLKPYTNQSSGVLTSVAWAEGYAVIPADAQIAAGDRVEFIPFSELA
ncbi:gephyrin-like molybdotransferase Glp [Motiliproteus sp.]|uniref:molybdopterin molybdotransferase MoeA n=1 Tax=Motiliproteus sp. TaxID=1898955 RepID=UPI003BAC710F